jgi:hypothetical protein
MIGTKGRSVSPISYGGDVGSTAAAMVGAAVTALTAGTAGFEGVAAGLAASRAGSAGTSSVGASAGAVAGEARALTAAGSGNQPAPPQQAPIATSSAPSGFALGDGDPTLEGHAEQIRSSISDVMGAEGSSDENSGTITVPAQGPIGSQSAGTSAPRSGAGRSAASARRGPSVHRYNLGTWTAYHAARIAAGTIAGATRRATDQE